MSLVISYSDTDAQAFNMSICDEYGRLKSSACNSMAWEFSNSSHDAEPYIGSVCRSHLLAWQDCAIGSAESGIVLVNAFINQPGVENGVNKSLQLLG